MRPECQRVRVANWSRYQHYKNRRPPWIKLHVELLDDYEFMRLHDASKLLALGCMLLAAETENHIPADPGWIGHKLHLETVPNLDALISVGFLEVCACVTCKASAPLAKSLQLAIPETETEVEKERETACSPAASETKTGDGFEDFWKAYPRKVGKKDARRAWGQTRKERPPVPEIVSKLDALARTEQWRDTQYIPHPATWLRRGGWDDDPAAMRSSNGGPRHLGGSRHVVPSEMSEEQRRLTEEAQRKIDSGEWRLE